jgi:tRNA(Arg) A34 adenosine deaminase TadA
MDKHEEYMRLAILEAKKAEAIGEVPIGAIIIDSQSGEIISKGYNQPIKTHDPTAHAEVIALREAAKFLENYRLRPDLSLYVTLEPCTMCAGAISFARIKTIVYGAYDKKGGAVENGVKFFSSPQCHHRPELIGGILENDCSSLLKSFFAKKRK